jgi:Zn-dependent peptidase ImmA (M78 family)
MDVLYRNIPEAARHDAIEQVCDYFAGCLLIPRPWLKKAWGQRIQSLDALAARFETSQAAMSVRLQQVGLAKQAPRCVNDTTGWVLPSLVPALDTWTYRRASSLVGAI